MTRSSLKSWLFPDGKPLQSTTKKPLMKLSSSSCRISSGQRISELCQKGGYLGSPLDRKEEQKLDEKVESLYL